MHRRSTFLQNLLVSHMYISRFRSNTKYLPSIAPQKCLLRTWYYEPNEVRGYSIYHPDDPISGNHNPVFTFPPGVEWLISIHTTFQHHFPIPLARTLQ